jgi:hypothetical protein
MWPFRKRIYGCHWFGFGDLWANCSRVARLSQTHDVCFSAYPGKDARLRIDRSALIREILDQLDLDTSRVRVVQDPMDPRDRYGVGEHVGPYVPTRVRWRGPGSRLVTYQLVTHTHHRPERLLPEADAHRFRAWCEARGWRALDLWRPQHPTGGEPPLAQCIEWLAESAFFVGIDSGMSHVAHSVGVPTHLYRWPALEGAHPGKAFAPFASIEALCAGLERAAP